MRVLTASQDMSEYLRGISDRIDDHGERWRPVVQTLAFELQAELAPGQPLYVRTYNTGLGNQIRFRLRNGRELKVTYHGGLKQISIRDAETNQTLHIFTWQDDSERVAQCCRELARMSEQVHPAAAAAALDQPTA